MHVLKVAELAHGEKLHTKSLTHSSNLFDALGTKLALPNCVIQCSLSSVQHVQSNFALYASGLLLHYLLPSCLMLFPCIVQVNAGNDWNSAWNRTRFSSSRKKATSHGLLSRLAKQMKVSMSSMFSSSTAAMNDIPWTCNSASPSLSGICIVLSTVRLQQITRILNM